MKRIPPSKQIKQENVSLLSEENSDEEDISAQLWKKAVQRALQKALEQEVADLLGRENYQRRREDEPHCGYRNGYVPKQGKTEEGAVRVKVPRSERLRSRIGLSFFRRSRH